MSNEQIIRRLEDAWEEGFFYQVRSRQLDLGQGEEIVSILDQIHLGEEKSIDRRLVSLLWYIPMFMSWQKESLEEKYGNDDIQRYIQLTNKFQKEVEQILGYP